ncbi:SH3 domain-containing protein [Hominenteromicrobium sp.]|uniref:SH3 domain-containing protein n=1 Tax=Hominenteromicrobium sp. TaxID=3073581 RepID=UPI003AB444ED
MQYRKRMLRKKGTALLLSALLLASALPLAAYAEEVSAKTTEYVNFRSGPGTNYSSQGIIASGTTITVTDTSNSEWYAVRLSNGSTGYIYAEYISMSTGGSTSNGEERSAKTTEYVNFRSGPGTNYSSKGVIALGTTVTVTDTSNSEWYAVRLSNGSTGYIFARYLKLNSSSSATATPAPTQAPSNGSEQTAKTTEYVNFRSGPGTNYSSKGVIALGTTVTVTDTSNSEWYAVRLSNGSTGYIFAQYLKLNSSSSATATPAPTQAPSGSEQSAKTTEYVNFRSGPGTNYSSKGVIASGTTVTVTDRSNSQWYAVRLANGSTGYIFAQYLKVTGTSSATPTPTQAPSNDGTVQAKLTADVNLRRGAGTNYGVIKVIGTGTTVTVTDASNSQWYKVKLSDGTEGYLFSEYLKVTSGNIDSAKPSATPTPTPAPSNGTVQAKTTSDLNVRKGPGTSYGIIKVIDMNVTVTVTEATNSSWYKVKLSDGTEGYLAAQYLKITSGDINSVKPGNSGDDNTNNGNNSNAPATDEYVRVTVGLNLRSEPNTSCKVLTVLSTGTVLNVLDRKTSGWVHVRTTGGAEGYVSAEYVTAYDPSSSSASVSVSSVDLAQYKTIYIQASSGSVTWESSDASVATAKAGVSGQLFIYGAAPGTAKITAKSANGTALATVSVTVSAPEAVRFAYTTPNIITAGASFNLKAVTDTQKSAVRFEIDGVGTYDTTSYDSESQGDNNVRIFSASATISTPGTYTVRAYSSSGGGYSSDYREFTILVVSTTDSDTTTGESRRVSDSMLDNIASYEGYVPQVSPDTLAGNIPTVGYGYVVSKNTTFYNNLTRSEAKAMLADTVNRGSYTTEINRFISSNGLLMSQCQFDALASFSYNVGAGYWNGSGNCYVRTVIMNAVVPPQDLSSSNPYGGKVTASTLPMYQGHSASSTRITTLKINTSVNILDYYRDSSTKQSWYKVSASGKSGWVRAGDVAFNSTSGLTHDLNYVDAYTFGSNLLDWHVAGGNCYIGLYYRRLAEAKVFSYGNYAEASPSNGNYKKNTYGYKVPSCL